ncbi:NlpC/P60 family protein [Thermoclostridium stercorarium]|uniref:NlpC/P60 family protein n=1 Tax=Thermoclostridium stercorarium TaxID=1510 RepID=UPI000A404E61|nr:NlpC/P60 family protein [Thermoclostridium stercorarium]
MSILAGVSSFAQQNIDLTSANDWAKAEIAKANEYNLLSGGMTDNFTRNITREEFCELAVRLYKSLSGKALPEVNSNPFSDTGNESVIIANKLGIVYGVGNNKFAPDNMATREEIAVMLYRTLKAAKPETVFSANMEYLFSDQDEISDWALKEVLSLTKAGIINGVGNGRFIPKRYISREEAIALVKRMYEKFDGQYVEIFELTSRGNSRNGLIEQLKTLIPQEMGKPYQWGATGPDSYDCSGLVYTLYGKIGVSLPRVSRDQAKAGVYVSKDSLQYGDLVFFAADGKNVNHVGIYVGNGEFVHAPFTGSVVKVSSLTTGYYSRTYYTARRVIR